MTLQEQVTSLEISKKLKELGVKQESFFRWVNYLTYGPSTQFIPSGPYLAYKDDLIFKTPYLEGKGYFSAFTVAELGEMLPIEYFRLQDRTLVDGYMFGFGDEEAVYANTEANARGLILIYLIENGLLKAKE